MALPSLKIQSPSKRGAVSPIEIFNSSTTTLRGHIQNLWEPQATALKEWDGMRGERDVVIKMSTGGGKTLVGLLIAQSIVNETKGKVLYICSTNQLVEQVRKSASEAGLKTAQYTSSGWQDEELFRQGFGCCITNYAAVFNSKSKFRKEQLSGVIFDDAHVAHSAIRGQFTVTIKSECPEFSQLVKAFVPYLESVQKQGVVQNIQTGKPNQLLYIPLFVSAENEALIRGAINSAIEADDTLSFAFGFLEEHLRLCTVIISSDRIEISPPILPIRTLQYFDQARRVYLTATMPSGVEFVRLFGAAEAKTISPGGKLGAAQRLLLRLNGDTIEEIKAKALDLLKKQKACVIVPSNSAAEKWKPECTVYDKKGGHLEILRFSEAKDFSKLVLVARFDGVDLPGNACRVLILQGLPVGSFLFEKFVDQGLRINRVRTSSVCARIVQAMGRIFRSNTDHGVVVLCGDDINQWVEDTDHCAYFPGLLQQQIQFAMELDKQIQSGAVTADQLIEGIISGDPEWDRLYQEFVPNAEVRELSGSATWAENVALLERTAFEKMWNANFNGAVLDFQKAIDLVPDSEESQLAWLYHLMGYSEFLAGNRDEAENAISFAADLRAELGRLPGEVTVDFDDDEMLPDPGQAQKFQQRAPKTLSDLKLIDKLFEGIINGPDTNKCEEAIKGLGFYLGVESSRPDKSPIGTGPDVLWVSDSHRSALGLECKTNKTTGKYKKNEDLGQISDHIQFIRDRFKGFKYDIAIVGPYLEVVAQSNPHKGLLVIEAEQIRGLAVRLSHALSEWVNKQEQSALEAAKLLKKYNLAWPGCYKSLESRLAIDLRPLSQPDLPTA